MPPYLFNSRDEKLVLQYVLLTRQITSIADCVQHIIRLGNKEDNPVNRMKYKAYTLHIQTELSDLYAQMVKLCNILDMSVEETCEMGMLRQREKKQEYLKKNPEDVWI